VQDTYPGKVGADLVGHDGGIIGDEHAFNHRSHDGIALLAIAISTQQLNIFQRISSTLGNGNYVIKLQVSIRTAIYATPLISIPYIHLNIIGDAVSA
jgi:hypothetical protein